LKSTKKTITKGTGSSFRAAANHPLSEQSGVFAYLDIKFDPEISSHKNSIFTHLGTAGSKYGAICLVHDSGNYYGGIAFSYALYVVSFIKQESVCYIEFLSSW
jgi:hypothetical protein